MIWYWTHSPLHKPYIVVIMSSLCLVWPFKCAWDITIQLSLTAPRLLKLCDSNSNLLCRVCMPHVFQLCCTIYFYCLLTYSNQTYAECVIIQVATIKGLWRMCISKRYQKYMWPSTGKGPFAVKKIFSVFHVILWRRICSTCWSDCMYRYWGMTTNVAEPQNHEFRKIAF